MIRKKIPLVHAQSQSFTYHLPSCMLSLLHHPLHHPRLHPYAFLLLPWASPVFGVLTCMIQGRGSHPLWNLELPFRNALTKPSSSPVTKRKSWMTC